MTSLDERLEAAIARSTDLTGAQIAALLTEARDALRVHVMALELACDDGWGDRMNANRQRGDRAERECIKVEPSDPRIPIVDDGWNQTMGCADPRCDIEVVRPGKVQCSNYCDQDDRPVCVRCDDSGLIADDDAPHGERACACGGRWAS